MKPLPKSTLFVFLMICALQIGLFLPSEAQAQHPLMGKKAPNVVLPDRQGSLRKLSNLQGKYTLLHFWATWDGQTSTTGHPEYKQLYNTFKSRSFKGAKGFSIFSVAFDEDRDKWLEQIRKDGVTWTNLVIEKATYDSQYLDTYDFRSMPYTFLLDPKGKVIGVNLSYDDLYKKLNSALVSPIPPPKAKDPNGGSTKPVDKPDKPDTKPTDTDDVKPPVVTPPITVTPPTSGKVYKVQLGVFRNPNLNKFSKLKDLGTLGTEKISPTSSLSRVLLGNYSKSSSSNILKTVKSRGYASAFLVTRTLSSTGGGSSSGGDSGSTTDKPPTKPTTKPTTKPPVSGTVYKIQLGVFRTPQLSKFSSLKSIGTLELESTPNGLKRVLLGSFSESERNAALAKVAAKGYKRAFLVKRTGTVSGGSNGGTTTKPSPTPSPSGNYKIQLGVFGKPNLNKFAKLKDLGTLGTERATSTLQRVMLGSFSKSKASEVLKKVKARGYRDAFVVKR
ncbi:MAG: thioredoxin-like domain-containing protein [Chitinophagales bacterium]